MRVLTFLGWLIVFGLPAVLASLASARLAKSSRDEWKLLVWLPVVPLALWGPYIAWDVTRDPTSHNLWPFELVFWGILSLALFGGVLLARRILGGPRNDWSTRRDRDGRT